MNVSQIVGLFFCALTIVSAISLYSFIIDSQQNILGHWVGTSWSFLLIQFSGYFSTMILLVVLAFFGSCLAFDLQMAWRNRIFVSLIMIYFGSSMILSTSYVLNDSLYNFGGNLGFFLNQLLFPIFAKQTLGYYLVSVPLLAFAFFWGLQISPLQLISYLVVGIGKIVITCYQMFESIGYYWKSKQQQKRKKRQNQEMRQTKPKKLKSLVSFKSNRVENVIDDVSLEEMSQKVNWSDPLEVRRYRDQEAELKRVKELNQWEGEQRQPTFAGTIMKKEKPILKINEELPVSSESTAPGIPQALTKDKKTGDTYDEYQIIDVNKILTDPPEQKSVYSEEDLKGQAALLEEQLANFKVMGKVVGICTGPIIVRYEIELAPGFKVNRVLGLADDLALVLKAKRIRILAPIPGKSLVGIEIPSLNPQIVYIKDVLTSPEFRKRKEGITFALGKNIAGDATVVDLAKSPHLLIAGQTGSGKSVCINAIMASILSSKTPDQVRMILIDPKVVELQPYNRIPHLLAPVIHQPELAVQSLQWTTYEMDRRYEVLSKVGVRNIIGFNEKFEKGELTDIIEETDRKKMAYIVVVVDELADLMMVAGKDVEKSIVRIAQKARAVGIHLIVATQRPSTNVITGTIKANLPTRIAFQVASYIDSRTIIDKAGAEKMLGRGDMLFRSIDSPEPERVHGAFVSDQEAEEIALACSKQFVDYPQIESFDISSKSSNGEEVDIARDIKFRDAAELVCTLRQASASLLQRKMAIGYARAGRLIDQLEQAGIVGKDKGSKPRGVYMSELEVQSFLSSELND